MRESIGQIGVAYLLKLLYICREKPRGKVGPIITNPVLIFFVVLIIILFAPLMLNRVKVPHVVGLIVAGVVVGPFGFNLLARDSSFEIFGQVGLLYLMFLAGLEIDINQLKKNIHKGTVFGALTFFVPLVLGTIASVWLLKLDFLVSLLLASMYASHTLISYPVISRFGITKSPAVVIAIVGTIIAVIAALLLLAIATTAYRTGDFSITDVLSLLLRLAVYCAIILLLYPRLTRRFFKRYNDNVMQYVYVMALVFLASWFAQVIGLEAVLGAFFGGLVLNRYIPKVSPLMHRIEFVGNALFIPYFLIGVGMMINVRVLADMDTIMVTVNMILIAIVGKWLAAYIQQKIYGMSRAERSVMFGLTTAHTAVALAVVTIGYNMIDGDGNRMMGEPILNATVLMILVTCTIAPISTAAGAAKLRIRMLLEEKEHSSEIPTTRVMKTLVPVSNPVTAASMVNMALMMKRKTMDGMVSAIHVRNENTKSAKAVGEHALKLAAETAAALNINIGLIDRYDVNTVAGIVNTVNERDITDVVVGMHYRTAVIDGFFGNKIENLIKELNKMVIVTRIYIPINTITRIIVMVPAKAEYETGFDSWVIRVGCLARSIGCRLIFCSENEQMPLIRGVLHKENIDCRIEFQEFTEWNDFVLVANKVVDDDLLVVISARHTSISYNPVMDEIPEVLQRYFGHNNLLVIYPEQFGEAPQLISFSDPLVEYSSSSPWQRLGRWIKRKFQ